MFKSKYCVGSVGKHSSCVGKYFAPTFSSCFSTLEYDQPQVWTLRLNECTDPPYPCACSHAE